MTIKTADAIKVLVLVAAIALAWGRFEVKVGDIATQVENLASACALRETEEIQTSHQQSWIDDLRDRVGRLEDKVGE